MKSTALLPCLLLCLLLPLFSGCQSQAERAAQIAAFHAAPIDPQAAPLIVTLTTVGKSLSMDHHYYLKQAVETALKTNGYPGKFEVARGLNVPPGSPELQVRVLRWGPGQLAGETECRLSIGLKKADGTTAWLGTFVGEDHDRLLIGSGQEVIDSYTRSATDAMLKAYVDLQPCFLGAPAPKVK